MKIKHTKGTTLQGGPTTYEITTTCGQIFEVIKDLSSWTCNGQKYSSIREIKRDIEDDNKPGQIWPDPAIEPDPPTEAKSSPLWACCCAACLFLISRPNDLEPLTKLERSVLDCYGLILENGEPDYEYAQKEVDRATKILDRLG